MKVLFICKYNRFRSKVAESLYNKLSKKKAKSAGFIDLNVPLIPEEKERNKYLNKKYGIKFDVKSRGIKGSDLLEANKIILVSNEIPKSMLENGRWKDKVVVWKVPDEPGANKKNIDKSVKIILNKVKRLVANT